MIVFELLAAGRALATVVYLVFALLKTGVVQVLIDPGMGRRNLVRCLAETRPEGFVAIPAAQVVDWAAVRNARLLLVNDSHRLSDHVQASADAFAQLLATL